jgi:DNA-binding NarL/FixJ family response regulator
VVTRVLLADDHPVVLAGIRSLILSDPEFEVVGEATDGEAAVRLAGAQHPDIAILDVSIPGLAGFDLVTRMVAEHPRMRVLMLTVQEDRSYVVRLLQAGARGYLLKRSAGDELLRAIRAIIGGGIYVDPAIASKLVGQSLSAGSGSRADLSERELEVIRFVSQGLSNKEIATRLELSIKSVETYRARAAEKIGAKSRAEIVRFGVGQGWLKEL